MLCAASSGAVSGAAVAPSVAARRRRQVSSSSSPSTTTIWSSYVSRRLSDSQHAVDRVVRRRQSSDAVEQSPEVDLLPLDDVLRCNAVGCCRICRWSTLLFSTSTCQLPSSRRSCSKAYIKCVARNRRSMAPLPEPRRNDGSDVKVTRKENLIMTSSQRFDKGMCR